MDASKFSNFSIDYILGENTHPHTRPHTHPPEEPPAAPQAFRGEFSEVNLLPSSAFHAQTRRSPLISLPAPVQCPGLYDSPYYNTFSCCGPVTYYQTNFSMNYCGTERWFHTHPDCDREDARCYQTGQQRQRNRIRTVFTENQTRHLDQLFSITEYPSVEARAELAKNTGLSEETVRVWFKNRRARRKRQKPSSELSPN